MNTLARIDKILVAQGLAKSRTLAQSLIKEGSVEVYQAGVWRLVEKPSEHYSSECELRLNSSESLRYVSRAGLKLEYAIERQGIDVKGKTALDLGQSTGGFSDCLLQRGCIAVTGVDVGHGQLDPRIRADGKVRCLEGVNARELDPEQIGGDFDLVVMDLSFISQTLVLPGIQVLMKEGAELLSLVKPQFEVGPKGIGKGGLVRDPSYYPQVQNKIEAVLNQLGFQRIEYFESPVLGGDGNKEFFVHAKQAAKRL